MGLALHTYGIKIGEALIIASPERNAARYSFKIDPAATAGAVVNHKSRNPLSKLIPVGV